jgi:hypothetical protein
MSEPAPVNVTVNQPTGGARSTIGTSAKEFLTPDRDERPRLRLHGFLLFELRMLEQDIVQSTYR